MVTSYAGENCPMVQLCCSEQITIPQSFPNILKTFAKAAIRTQPYDILRWSAAYFRCLAYNATPPAKIRLERECRRGTLTKGYLKVLVTQVGKGFFISRCLLQEQWKALCLPEDDLLKYLSLCRMLNWPQVHWLKLLAVMIGSLSETPQDTMAMVCELLTDDMDGGLARIPYWMFKICYTFVAQLECSQEQCFVNGQMVLPWGDLEEAIPMHRLPRVLSATLLKDTIMASCKAKFDKPHYRECNCPPHGHSGTESANLLTNSHLDDPKEFLSKCEDFDTIMLILQNAQDKPVTEDDFRDEHYIFETQLQNAQQIKKKSHEQRQVECNQNVQDFMQQEALQMLREVGPPWTWLHQFTTSDCDTASYNFIHQESVLSDAEPSIIFPDSVKEGPNPEVEMEEKYGLENLKSLIEDAIKENKCELKETASIISFLQSKELPEGFESLVDLNEIIKALQQAEADSKIFRSVEQLIEHTKVCLRGNIKDKETQRKGSTSTNEIDASSNDVEPEAISVAEKKSESTQGLVHSTEANEDTVSSGITNQKISADDHRQNSESLLAESDEPRLENISTVYMKYYCCDDASAFKPEHNAEPPQQFYCSLGAIPGIGATVSQKTIDDFLSFLRSRSRSQRGLISPRNFKEERCPCMVDIKLN